MFIPERKKFKPRRPAATALAFAAEVRLFNPIKARQGREQKK
jgi:hypothetical protein